MNALSREEKEAEVLARLARLTEVIGDRLHEKALAAFASGSVPPQYYEKNQLLERAILDSWCRDRDYSPYPGHEEHFDNIHRCAP